MSLLPARLALSTSFVTVLCLLVPSPAAAGDEAVDVQSRRELFVDDYLIDTLSEGVSLQVQQPKPQEVVLVTGESWEGNTCAYYSIFQDGDLYRMYYRGSHTKDMKGTHPEVTCYAESTDGVQWKKPNLGLHEWEGSKRNNIVWNGIGTHCFTPFKDENPACAADAKYKAISRGRPQGKKGLYVFKSPDGIHWSLIKDDPVITEGYFDSQNLTFWDPVTGKYVDYHRTFIDGIRTIMMCTSDDFVTWTKPILLKYPDSPNQHLYTSAIRSYMHAPHIRIGFPTRFTPKTQQVEPVFMSSRDGVTFRRFDQAIIPQTAPRDRDGNRSNYMTHALLELPGHSNELSVYATEAYYAGPDSRVRRFTYRTDGFVALTGNGEVLTKPIRFDGDTLNINYRCKDGGSLSVEVCNASGTALDGFSRTDCASLNGDETDQVVSWKHGSAVAGLAGESIRLRFVLKNAELYAIQFRR